MWVGVYSIVVHTLKPDTPHILTIEQVPDKETLENGVFC